MSDLPASFLDCENASSDLCVVGTPEGNKILSITPTEKRQILHRKMNKEFVVFLMIFTLVFSAALLWSITL